MLDVSAEEHAMWMRMRSLVADELGHHVEDGVLVRMLAGMVADGAGAVSRDEPSNEAEASEDVSVTPSALDAASAEDAFTCDETYVKGEKTSSQRVQATRATAERAKAEDVKRRASRPPLLHAVSTCARCVTTFAVTAGTEAPLTDAERSRTDCDALTIGDVREDCGRVQYAIPAATRLKVFVRDKFRCAVPGCRSKRCLEIHHIEPRSLGGTNALSNLILLCAGHHQLHHDGRLRITGQAPAVQITWVHPDPTEAPAGQRVACQISRTVNDRPVP